MNLVEFARLPAVHTLSAEDASSLNSDLALRGVAEIPKASRKIIADYLICALNMNSADPAMTPKLESLLCCLQNEYLE
jgi:hypothetical protein